MFQTSQRRELGNAAPARRIARAISPVILEVLESRRLLSTHPWTITAGHTDVYLEPGSPTGRVEVHLDSSGGFLDHTFTNTDGMDVISAGTQTGVTFHADVPAALKPTTDGTDDGIKVVGSSGCKLEVNAGEDDKLIEVTAATSTTGTVRTQDTSIFTYGYDRWASGVSKLILRANNNGFATINVGSVGLPDTLSLDIETGAGTNDNINLIAGDLQLVHNAVIHTGAGDDVVWVGPGDDDADGSVSATVDFDSTSLDSGNELHIIDQATVTLAHTTSSTATIAVDVVTVQSELDTAILHVTDPALIGELHLWSNTDTGAGTETAIVDAASTINTLECQYGGTALIEYP